MGYSAGWILVQGSPPPRLGRGAVHTALQAAPLGTWSVLEDPDWAGASSTALGAASVGTQVACLYLEEHVMSCIAAGWANGELLWLVRSDAARVLPARHDWAVRHLGAELTEHSEPDEPAEQVEELILGDIFAASAGVVVQGDPPGLAAALEIARTRTLAANNLAVDHYFDVPQTVFAQATGVAVSALTADDRVPTALVPVGEVGFADLSGYDDDPLPPGTRVPDGLPLTITDYPDADADAGEAVASVSATPAGLRDADPAAADAVPAAYPAPDADIAAHLQTATGALLSWLADHYDRLADEQRGLPFMFFLREATNDVLGGSIPHATDALDMLRRCTRRWLVRRRLRASSSLAAVWAAPHPDGQLTTVVIAGRDGRAGVLRRVAGGRIVELRTVAGGPPPIGPELDALRELLQRCGP